MGASGEGRCGVEGRLHAIGAADLVPGGCMACVVRVVAPEV
jgi:hypothetical protein